MAIGYFSQVACQFLSQKSADASAATQARIAVAVRALEAKHKNDPQGLKEERLAATREIQREYPPVAATLEDVVAHIDHVVQIAGVDSVGIGSDFDGVGCVPVGLSDVSMWPNLTRALLELGYMQSDIQKIYGENLLRVMSANERVAREMRESR